MPLDFDSFDELATLLKLDPGRLRSFAEAADGGEASAVAFDIAIAALDEFSEEQLIALLDAAWQTYRSRSTPPDGSSGAMVESALTAQVRLRVAD